MPPSKPSQMRSFFESASRLPPFPCEFRFAAIVEHSTPWQPSAQEPITCKIEGDMKSPQHVLIPLLLATVANAGQPDSFAPFEAWKAAVMAGDKAALAKLYSTHPAAAVK